jgi:translation initiation factor IF-2
MSGAGSRRAARAGWNGPAPEAGPAPAGPARPGPGNQGPTRTRPGARSRIPGRALIAGTAVPWRDCSRASRRAATAWAGGGRRRQYDGTAPGGACARAARALAPMQRADAGPRPGPDSSRPGRARARAVAGRAGPGPASSRPGRARAGQQPAGPGPGRPAAGRAGPGQASSRLGRARAGQQPRAGASSQLTTSPWGWCTRARRPSSGRPGAGERP